MRAVIKVYLYFFVLLVPFASKGTHIMGGGVTYKYLGNNKYALEFAFYRDCSSSNNAAMPTSIDYFIRAASSSTSPRTKKTIKLVGTATKVSNAASGCASSYCAEKGIFRDTITEGTDTVGYHIFAANAARNGNITNLNNPGGAGMEWYAFLPPRKYQNSSPNLVKVPVPVICAKKKNIFNAGFYDPDGDSLVFSVVTPYDSSTTVPTFRNVSYKSGYSVKYPFGTGDPAIKIDSATGEITAEPSSTGNYVISIQVQEYRVNPITHAVVYMGQVRVDLQFIATSCGSNPAPWFEADTAKKPNVRTVLVGQQLCFKIIGRDTAKYNGKYDTLTLTAVGAPLGNTVASFSKPWATFTNKKADTNVTSTFCWTPSCAHVTYTSAHIITFRLEDQGCNTVEQSWSIYVKPRPFVAPPKLKCASIVNTSINTLNWDTTAFDTGFKSYSIYRKKAPKGSWTPVKNITKRTTNTWNDSTALNNNDSIYQYYVTSVNGCGVEGASSDTISTIVVTSQKLSYGATEFDWNSMSPKIKDSFLVYGDTGTGMKLLATVNARKYVVTYCKSNIKVHVVGLPKGYNCQFNGSTTPVVALKDVTAPTANKLVNATVSNTTNNFISWNASVDPDVNRYVIYRSVNGTGYVAIDSVNYNASTAKYTYTDSKSVDNSKNVYCYNIIPVDQCSNRGSYSPYCLFKLSGQGKQMYSRLTWKLFSGYTLSKIQILRYDKGAWSAIGNASKVTDTLYNDTNVTCKSYYYKIAGYESGGNSQITYSDSILVSPIDTISPPAPVIYYVTNTSSTSNSVIFRTLSATTKDARKYIIYRATNGGTASVIDTIWSPINTTYTYIDKTANPLINRYTYTVKSLDSCGHPSKSASAPYTTMELRAKPLDNSVQLNWYAYKPGPVTKYYILRAKDNGAFAIIDSVKATDTIYTNIGLKCNEHYSYRVYGVTTAGAYKTYSDTAKATTFDTVKPATVNILYASVSSDTSINVAFNKVSDQDVITYQVWGSVNGAAYTLLKTYTSPASFPVVYQQGKLNTLKNRYCYKVYAIDSCAANKSIASETHCAVNGSGKAGNLSSILKWMPYQGFSVDKYYVQRYIGSAWKTIDSTKATDTFYTDKKSIYCNARYNYRVIAKELGGDKQSANSDTIAVMPFDTIKPNTVNVLYASVKSDTSIDIAFAKVSDTDVIKYEIWVSTNGGAYTLVKAVIPSSFPYVYRQTKLNTLKNRYCYKVYAVDSCASNKSLVSETHCAVNVSAKAGNLSSILKWMPYTGFTVDKYYVQRYIGGVWTIIDSTKGTDTLYTDKKSIYCNTKYNYAIVAKELGGDKQFSFSDTTATIPFDTIRPNTVNLLYATVKSDTSIDVAFTKVSDTDVVKYEVWVSTNGGAYTLAKTIIPGSFPYVYTQGKLNTVKNRYCYKVFAVDSCASNKSLVSETHCAVNVSAKAGNLSSILKWMPYTGFTVDKYYVLRFIGSTWKVIDSTKGTDTFYTDKKSIYCNTKYNYTVVAKELGGDKQFSVSDTAATIPFDTIRPNTVNLINASVKSDTSIDITFNKVADTDVVKYEIWVSTNGGAYSLVKSVVPTAFPYVYTQTKLNTLKNRYCYKVYAVDSCATNKSLLSETHCAIQASAKAGDLVSNLKWMPYKGFSVDKYYVYKYISSAWQLIDSTKATDTFYTDKKGIYCKTTYNYKIVARELGGDKQFSTSDTVATIPFDTVKPAQVNIRSVSVFKNSSIQIKFDTVADQDVNKYLIYVSKNGGAFTVLDSVNKPSGSPYTYTHTGINTVNDNYSYMVKAMDNCQRNKSLTSEVHAAMKLGGTGGDYSSLLKWNKYRGFLVDKYYVEHLVGTTWTTVATLKNTDSTYTDAPEPCLYQYYRIRAEENGGDKAISYSDSFGIKPFDTVKPISPQILSASVKNGNVVITWIKSSSNDVRRYDLYRRKAPVGFRLYKTLGDVNTYTDKSADTVNSQCYEVIAVDSCANNQSAPSKEHCTVSLTVTVDRCVQKIFLNWTSYSGWNSVKQYNIMRSDNTSGMTLAYTVSGSTTSFADSLISSAKTYCYRIDAIDAVNDTASSSTYCNKIYPLVTAQILHASKITTSTTTGQVEIKWQSVKGKRYYKYYHLYGRKHGAASFTLLAGNIPVTQQDSFIQKNVNTKTLDWDYYLVIEDTCGNKLKSSIHKTMLLDGTIGQLVTKLYWTPYKGWLGGVAKYVIERRESSGYSPVDTVPGTDTSTRLFPAPCNHNLFYRITAFDGLGNYAYSDTIGRQAIDTIPSNPAKFKNASVTNGTSNRIDFIGADSADDFRYAIQRSQNGVWTTAGFVYFNSPSQVLNYIDKVNTLTDVFDYTIVTLDSCLNATPSDTFQVMQLRGTALNEANQLRWYKFKGNYKLAKQELLIWKNNGWQVLRTLAAKDTAFLHDSLHCGIPYTYKIRGISTSGTYITMSDSIQLIPIDTIIPPHPAVQYVDVLPDHTTQIRWRYDAKTDIKYFDIYRSLNHKPWAKIGSTTFDSTFNDKSINTKTDTASYYVISIDSCDIIKHRSAPSDTDRFMHLKVVTGACTPEHRLSWSAYQTFNKGTDSFIVYRRNGSSAWAPVKYLNGKSTSYIDNAVSLGTWYCYKVVAINKKDNVKSSTDSVCITPWVFPYPDPMVADYVDVLRTDAVQGQVYVQWEKTRASDTFARGYRIYHSVNGGPYTLLYDTKGLGINWLIHKNINTKDNYHSYYVAAYNLCQVEGKPSTSHKAMVIQANNANMAVTLNWNRYEGQPVNKYKVLRSHNGAKLVLIATLDPTDTSYTDTQIYCRQSYIYIVKAELSNNYVSASDSIEVFTFDSIPPAKAYLYGVTVDTTDKNVGTISINWFGNSKLSRAGYDIYRSVNTGPFSFYRFITEFRPGIDYWQDNGLNTVDNVYSYYVRAKDSCGNTADAPDTHTVMHLLVKAHSQYMQIDWTDYKGWKKWNYILERRTKARNWIGIAVFNPGTISYHDSNVTCHVYYDYRIRAYNSDTSWISFSNISGDTAYEDVPPAMSGIMEATVISTSTNKGIVGLRWQPSASNDIYGYNIFRSTDGIKWTQIKSKYRNIAYYDSNLNTYKQAYYYRIRPVDSCGNLGVMYSFTHTTIEMHVKDTGLQATVLHWNGYKGWPVKYYVIMRDDTVLTTIAGNIRDFMDTMVTCDHIYHYKIMAIADSAAKLISMSNEDSVPGIDKKAPQRPYLKSVSVSVPNKEITLTWDPSPSWDVTKYYIYYMGDDGRMHMVDSTSGHTYVRKLDNEPRDPHCYVIMAADGCGNKSYISNRGCVIILKGQAGKNLNNLDWNAYKDWTDGVARYNVYKSEDNMGWLLVGATKPNEHSFTDDKLSDNIIDYCYQIEAVETNGQHNGVSSSTIICLHQDPIVYIPNSFSPYSTFGLNDTWGPKGMFIKGYEINLYNRWGQLILKTTDQEWDGKIGDVIVPEGVYMYRIRIDGYNLIPHYYNGTLTIIR